MTKENLIELVEIAFLPALQSIILLSIGFEYNSDNWQLLDEDEFADMTYVQEGQTVFTFRMYSVVTTKAEPETMLFLEYNLIAGSEIIIPSLERSMAALFYLKQLEK
jgi:hypothetical protein